MRIGASKLLRVVVLHSSELQVSQIAVDRSVLRDRKGRGLEICMQGQQQVIAVVKCCGVVVVAAAAGVQSLGLESHTVAAQRDCSSLPCDSTLACPIALRRVPMGPQHH